MSGPMAPGRQAPAAQDDTAVAQALTPLLGTPLRPGATPPPNGSLYEDASLALPQQTILSFDIEEHYRIEAAVGLAIDAHRKTEYRDRMDATTRWLLDVLAERNLKATFFVVGKIAEHKPDLIRAIHAAGHEVASHSWDHKRVQHFTPGSFREDLKRSRCALEQLTGEAVVGFRAPTFSIVHGTGWALDVLAEEGFVYDSSIYPIRHDRYGIRKAPRVPFLALGREHTMLELPPATFRLLWANVPVGGGGYFRLLPLFLMNRGLRQLHRRGQPSVAMIYFHPWEFDVDQPRLPMSAFRRLRTYVGMKKSRQRLVRLLQSTRFSRAIDVAELLKSRRSYLPQFQVQAAAEDYAVV